MRDDEQFNIFFVKKIQANKCLYDYTRADYKNVQMQEKAWLEIADEFKENVSLCKERWRNLRGCFTRHLKQKATEGMRYRKPYYLADHMQFIYPFTKSRKSFSSLAAGSSLKLDQIKTDVDTSSGKTTTEYQDSIIEECPEKEEWVQPQEEEHEEEEIQLDNETTIQLGQSKNESEIIITQSQQSPESTPITFTTNEESSSRKRKYEEILSESPPNKYPIEATYYEFRKEHDQVNDADWFFLKSLLPDIHSMSPQQKRKLRILFLNDIDNILTE